MLANLWRRLFGRRVFLSYREREPDENALAEIIASGLKDHDLHPLLERDKHSYTGEFSRHLYRLLAGAEGVVAIISQRTKDSQWLFFEALTAKQQNKLQLVVFSGTELNTTLGKAHKASTAPRSYKILRRALPQSPSWRLQSRKHRRAPRSIIACRACCSRCAGSPPVCSRLS
jgi:hypothetical protein